MKIEMEKEQELEWSKAQSIGISVDLVTTAKQQLQFLAAVDRNRYLYEGKALQRAIYRYNACWLSLLAKHSESQVFEGPLVVPLDCEWIWHCHRLNPVRYKTDCEELYGKILDNSNVVSSVQGSCKSKTEEIWNCLYPEEPYIFSLQKALSEDISERNSKLDNCTKYDLVSAVRRQCPFFYQLHPVSYCKDLHELLGKVLEHDDMDSDRTKGKKLDTGFSGTAKQWEEAFGTRYWRAGAMYRGSAPSPLTTTPYQSNIISKDGTAPPDLQKVIELPEVKAVEVLLEFLEVKNLPEGHKGMLFASFNKTTQDIFFNAKRLLSIFSEFGEKQNQDAKSWTQVIDETGAEVLHLQMRWVRLNCIYRDAEMEEVKGISVPKKEVVGITKSGKICTLAECVGTGWSLIDSHWSLHCEKNSEGHLFLLKGKKMVKFFPGRKLDYEPKQCEKLTSENKTQQHFMTLVEFSAEDPYGKAVALLDLKSGCIKVKEESITVPGIIMAFILSNKLKKERYGGFAVNAAEMGSVEEEINENPKEDKETNLSSSGASEVKLKSEVVEGNVVTSQKGGGCGGACGSGCGNATRTAGSGGCGSGCGGGCGTMEKSSGCSSGCGGGCRNLVQSGGCGGCGAGCGGGCGNILKSGGCGGCGSGCGGGCGSMLKSGGCGGCGGSGGCGGGCGSLFKGNGLYENTSGNSCAEDSPKAVVV
ncbi:hypothetical protein ACLB2K_003893 [Fragaria x ananassa]